MGIWHMHTWMEDDAHTRRGQKREKKQKGERTSKAKQNTGEAKE